VYTPRTPVFPKLFNLFETYPIDFLHGYFGKKIPPHGGIFL
jgi:hypothetical protein